MIIQCATTEQRPGHEQPFRCRLPEGHAIPIHNFAVERVAEAQREEGQR